MGGGWAGVGGGIKARPQAPTRKTEDVVECRQNIKMLRQCPLATAQQLVYYAVAVSTAVRSRVIRTMSVALLLNPTR